MYLKHFCFLAILLTATSAVFAQVIYSPENPIEGKRFSLLNIEDCEDKLDKTQIEPAEQAKIKAAIIREITAYLEQFEDTHFGSVISIGDPTIFADKINQNVNLIYIGKNGACLIRKNSPNAESYHHTWKVIGQTANIVFPFVPDSAMSNKQRQTLMHEMTHHIEWLLGVKESSKTILGKENPRSERNTNYQDFVVNALVDWKRTENLIREKKENLPSAIHDWKTLEEKLTDLEKGSAAGNNPHDENLKSMNGFDVKFESIKQKYLSGNVGEDFKTFVLLADLLPKMDPNLDLERDGKPVQSEETIELTEGESVNVSAMAVNNAVAIELDSKIKAHFYWNAVGLEPQEGKTFSLTATKANKRYEVKVDLRVPFNNHEYSIARANFFIATKPKEKDETYNGKIWLESEKKITFRVSGSEISGNIEGSVLSCGSIAKGKFTCTIGDEKKGWKLQGELWEVKYDGKKGISGHIFPRNPKRIIIPDPIHEWGFELELSREDTPNDVRDNEPVSLGALDAKAIARQNPAYPAMARSLGLSGDVEVEILVDTAGNVESAEAVSGHPLLRASAVQAARSARFRPYMQNGRAVKVKGTLTYEFSPASAIKEPEAVDTDEPPNENPDWRTAETPDFSGTYDLVANGYPARLEITGTPGNYTGRVLFQYYGKWETLTDVEYLASTGTFSFTRPRPGGLVGYAQNYSGKLNGTTITGTFLQQRLHSFEWRATRK